MQLKLEMPLIDPSLRGGKVLEWRKQEGDRVAFGETICTLAVDEFAALRRTGRATKLAGRRRKSLRTEVEVRRGKVLVRVALVASDNVILRRIVAGPDAPISIGDLLAVVSTDDAVALEGTEESWKQAPSMRVVANVLHEDSHDDLEEDD